MVSYSVLDCCQILSSRPSNPAVTTVHSDLRVSAAGPLLERFCTSSVFIVLTAAQTAANGILSLSAISPTV